MLTGKLKHKKLFFIAPFVLISVSILLYAVGQKNSYNAAALLKIENSFGIEPADAVIISKALRNLNLPQKGISPPSVKSDVNTGITNISIKGANPRVVVGLVNEIANVYLAEISSKAKGSGEGSEQKRSKESEEYKMTLEDNLKETKKILDESERRLDEINEEYKKSEFTLASSKEDFRKLESERAVLLKTYTPLYPGVVRIDADMARIKEEMKSLPPRPSGKIALEQEVSINTEKYNSLKEAYEKIKNTDRITAKLSTIISYADRPNIIFDSKKRVWLIAIGFIAALICALITAALAVISDSSMLTEKEVADYTGLPIAGAIPYIGPRPLLLSSEDRAEIIEPYRHLYNNVDKKSILLISAVPHEGKSVTAVNLALVMARAGKRALIIDCNLTNPALHTLFGIDSKRPGLIDILNRGISLNSAMMNVTDMLLGNMKMHTALKFKGLDRINIITRGLPLSGSGELLRSDKIDTLLSELKTRFDFIILDGPSLSRSVDGAILAPKCDAAFVVYSAGNTPRNLLKDAAKQIPLKGVILNKCI